MGIWMGEDGWMSFLPLFCWYGWIIQKVPMERQDNEPKQKQEPPLENNNQSASFQNSQLHSALRDLVRTRTISEDSELYRSLSSVADVLSRTASYERSAQYLESSRILQGNRLSQSYNIQSHPNEITLSEKILNMEEEKHYRHQLQNQSKQLVEQLMQANKAILRLQQENKQIKRRIKEEEENRRLEDLSQAELEKATQHYYKKIKRRIKEEEENRWLKNRSEAELKTITQHYYKKMIQYQEKYKKGREMQKNLQGILKDDPREEEQKP